MAQIRFLNDFSIFHQPLRALKLLILAFYRESKGTGVEKGAKKLSSSKLFKVLTFSMSLDKSRIALLHGLLTSRVMSSSTMRFYFGTRPVLEPEEMQRAPVSVMEFDPTVGSGEFMCSGSIAYS